MELNVGAISTVHRLCLYRVCCERETKTDRHQIEASETFCLRSATGLRQSRSGYGCTSLVDIAIIRLECKTW